MNRGLLGFDDVRRVVGHYQTPYVSMTAYAAGKRYAVPHPLQRRPIVAQPLLRCRAVEGGYSPRDETIFIPTDSTVFNGVSLLYRPDSIEFIFPVASFSLKNKSSGNTFATTAANWDLCFLVLG